MFSATWPKEVQHLARDYCYSDPCQVRIGKEDSCGGMTVNKDISQTIQILNSTYDKYDATVKLMCDLTRDGPRKVLIFCATKRGVDELERNLKQEGQLRSARLEARGIHGDKVQYERDRSLNAFKQPLKDGSSILIATDVASRGLDVRDISVVINYDLPTNIEDYVHRIGRTGRAGDKGSSYSFLVNTEFGLVNDLLKIMKSSGQKIPQELYDMKQDAMAARGNKRQRYRQQGEAIYGMDSMPNYQNKYQRATDFDRSTHESAYSRNNGGGGYGQNDNDKWGNGSKGHSDSYVNKRDQKYESKQNDKWGDNNGGGNRW